MGIISKKKKQFTLEPNRLIYGNDAYSYHEIQHISFVQSKTDVRMNFIQVDEINESYLELTMRSGVKLKVEVSEKMYLIGFSQDKSQALSDLFDAFVFLSEKTIHYRLAYYISQVQRLGYFVYADGKFYPDGRISMPGGETINISDYSIFKSGYYIKLKPPSSGEFMAKLKKALDAEGGYSIPVTIDRDVFFTLVLIYFGWRWTDN